MFRPKERAQGRNNDEDEKDPKKVAKVYDLNLRGDEGDVKQLAYKLKNWGPGDDY